MANKQDFNSLIAECTNALRENKYSETTILNYQRNWNRVHKYMEEHSINDYCEDIGELFMDSFPDCYPTLRQKFRRSIYLLADYANNGVIRQRIVPYTNHELDGEIGVAAKQFLASLSSKRLTKKTLKIHQCILSYFVKHLSMKSVVHPCEITEDDILSFVASTQNSKNGFSTIRQFCRYLYEQKIVKINIGYVIGKNNIYKREKLPSVYNADEIKQIEDAVDRASKVGKRDYAMLLLATRLGLRSSDIAGLQFINLDWEKNRICLLQFKTKRKIELPLLTDVGEAIIDYIKYGRPDSHYQNVFISARAPYRPVTTIAINRAVSEIIRTSHINLRNRNHGPHAMRHTLASRLLQNGVALPVISEALGHASTQTTMDYLRIDFNGLMNCALDVSIVSDKFYIQKGGVFYE
jgi:site-specific recombinase XerD